MKVSGGADKKRAMVLGGLLVVLLLVYLWSSGSDVPDQARNATPARPSRTPTPVVPGPAATTAAKTSAANRSSRARTLQEFRPSLKPKKPEDRDDPMTVDPTIRLVVLTKLQSINVNGTHRSIFDFAQAPAPDPKLVAGTGAVRKIPLPFVGPPAPPPPAPPVAPAPPPPIPLKFYGYVNAAMQGPKTAFFLEGEDIHVVKEGDMVKRRYRIVRIGVNSVVVEDTTSKSQQTLPLEEQPG